VTTEVYSSLQELWHFKSGQSIWRSIVTIFVSLWRMKISSYDIWQLVKNEDIELQVVQLRIFTKPFGPDNFEKFRDEFV
jgi:hypothetical protein